MLRKLLFVLLAAGLAGPAAGGETLTFVADEYCPYNCAPGAARPGYVIELLQRAFARKGIEVRYAVMGWEDAIKAVRAGKHAGIIAALEDDAPDFVFPELEIARSSNGFAVRKGDPWRYAGPVSLEGRRLGVVEGYEYGPEVERFIDSHPQLLHRVKGDGALAKLVGDLAKNKVDVVVEDLSVLVFLSKADPAFAGVTFAGATRSSDPLHVAFAPGAPRSKEYAKILDDGIAELRASGELAKLLAKYGLEDWR